MEHRKIVPINTGRVQIGVAYIPKPCPRRAVWIERHTAPGRGIGWWIAASAVALVALSLIAGAR